MKIEQLVPCRKVIPTSDSLKKKITKTMVAKQIDETRINRGYKNGWMEIVWTA